MDIEHEGDEVLVVKDANGNLLQNGDTVLVIKDLKVKGSAAGLKKGTKVRDIRLSDEVEGVTGKIEGMKGIYIRAEFVKKA
jgi:protein PhnA